MSRVLPILFNTEMVRAILNGRKTATRRVVKFPVNKFLNAKPPYQSGDILYVRETVWQKTSHYLDIDGETKAVFCDEFRYVATDEEPEVGWNYSWAKRPSIHMPKEAARIWLKVTDVRVERLQEIKNFREEGIALSESCEECYLVCGGCDPANSPTGCDNEVEIFSNLWDSTLKKSDLDRYGWDANPWVWVIEFERYKKPEGELCKEGN